MYSNVTIKEFLKSIYECKDPQITIGVNFKIKTGYITDYYYIEDLINMKNYSDYIGLKELNNNNFTFNIYDNMNKDVFTKNFDKIICINIK